MSTLLPTASIHSVCCAVAGGWCWFAVREKYCWLAGGCWLVLVWCERKTCKMIFFSLDAKWVMTDESITLFTMLWLVLICCERKVLLAAVVGGWCWFDMREKYYWLATANKRTEWGFNRNDDSHTIQELEGVWFQTLSRQKQRQCSR